MDQYQIEAEVEAIFREAADEVSLQDQYEGITPIPLDEESLSIKNELRRELLTDSPDLVDLDD
jgi:hypothetical protein